MHNTDTLQIADDDVLALFNSIEEIRDFRLILSILLVKTMYVHVLYTFIYAHM